MKNAVEMKNVSYSYQSMSGENPVLKNVDFTLEYGKITLIAGSSGEGKSTLFYIMNGVIPNNYSGKLSGDTFIDGENNKGKSIGEICKKVGSVFQNANEQIIQKYVKDEIAFGPENLGQTQEEIERKINYGCELMHLNKDDETLCLSGGQKQRLVTAATLSLDTDIIILDEPLANLDKQSSILLMEKLVKLKNTGKAIAIVEHRLDMVMPYVDVVYSLSNCKLEKQTNMQTYLTQHINQLEDICPAYQKSQILIDVNDVRFSISQKEIIKGLSFEINKGERVVILGDNGCGKTTITKIIARLLKQDSGKITQSINTKLGQKKGSKKWFKTLAYVFQDPNYQLFMPSVEDELLFAAHSLDYCQKISNMFDLEPLLDFHPHSLSRGQKRKVSIAAMLAIKPEVVILDEPTVGQDYQSLKKLVNNINTLHNEENNTIITITHDVRCAKALCDKAIAIEDGKVIGVGGKELIDEYFEIKSDKVV